MERRTKIIAIIEERSRIIKEEEDSIITRLVIL